MKNSVSCFNCGRPTGDQLTICTKCTGSLIADLRAVPGLVNDMTITRARLDRMSRGQEGGKSAETAVPVRLIGKALIRPTDRPLDHLETEILTAAHDFAAHLYPDQDDTLLGGAYGTPGLRQLTVNNAAGPRRDQTALTLNPTRDVEMAAIWIACHPNELRRLPWIDHLYYAITDTISSVRRAVDRLPELAYKGTCTYTEWDGTLQRVCGADLYAERGEDRLYCPKCKTPHDTRQLDRTILARMRDMNYTIPELLTLLTELGSRVPKSTVYSWTKDRKIKPRGWKRDGRITDTWIHRNDPPVYRLGDVLDLATRTERSTG